jgi:hypothetical protein
MDPYFAEIDGDIINTWGHLRPDDGKFVDESPGVAFKMSVHFPGILFMEMTPKLHLLAACAPIDEESSWLALVYFQSYLKFPVIGRALAWLSAFIELKFVHPDDERLLHEAEPRHPTARSYHLIHADKGVALWLQHMDRQLKRATPLIEETKIGTRFTGR